MEEKKFQWCMRKSKKSNNHQLMMTVS
jgi:hypothetical protein